MSDKSKPVTCHLCGDTGIVHFEGGDENCAVCHARMVLDTGAGVAPLTVGVAPYPDRYIKPALGHGASGIENVTCGACGRPDRVLTAALADRDATIAEKSAEIERLTTLHTEIRNDIADYNVMRLEVQRLKDLNFEAQDRYAALEAERDALKRAIDAAMRTIAAQNAQVRAMNEQLDAVTQLIVQRMEEFHP